MRIAITGSWRDEDVARWSLRDEDGFFRAMTTLGRELVTLGHRLVVATDSPHTADGAAIDGAVQALPEDRIYSTPVVELLRTDQREFTNLAARRPGFVVRSAPPDADVIKLYQVRQADVVLAVGGAEKTFEATIAAAVAGKRVVPIGCFGGAAEKAVKVFEASAGSWGPHVPSHDILGSLAAGWVL